MRRVQVICQSGRILGTLPITIGEMGRSPSEADYLAAALKSAIGHRDAVALRLWL